MDQVPLIEPDDEQRALPGIPPGRITKTPHPQPGPGQIPLMVAARDELGEWPLRPSQPGPAQMRLDSDQPPLEEVEPAPVQLALLPDPPIWEPEPPQRPAPPPGRLGRRRSKRGISPGQRSLF